MLDSLILENREIPTALVVTSQFAGSAKTWLAAQGADIFPFAVVEHPVSHISGAQMEDRAEQAIPPILSILIRGNADQASIR